MRRNLATLDRNTWQPSMRLIQEAMAHGLTNDMIYGGLLVGQTAVQSLEIHQQTQNCLSGTRRVTIDGRVFRYGRATAAVGWTSAGMKFWAGIADGIGYAAPTQIQAIGDSTISILASQDLDEDELAGGYMIIHSHIGHDMCRFIVSNTAAVTGNATVITVDVPWPVAIAVAYGTETTPPPYSFLRQTIAGGDAPIAGNNWSSVAGMPQCKVTVANDWLWIQTWGPCWITPHGDVAYVLTANRRHCFFDAEGVIHQEAAADQSTTSQQHAGFLLNREDGGTEPPLFMLQISP